MRKRDCYSNNAALGRQLARHPDPTIAKAGRTIQRLVADCRALMRACRSYDDLLTNERAAARDREERHAREQ